MIHDSPPQLDKILTQDDASFSTSASNLSSASNNVDNDIPPDGGYGWVCVFACFVINAHTWGLNSAYGVFLAHYLSNHTFAGATRTQYAFVGGLSNGIAFIISPAATYCIRKCGTRTTLMIGCLVEALSFLAASFSTKLWQLFLSQGVGFGIGMGFLFVGNIGPLSQWFKVKRSLANGVAASGSGIGGLAYSLAVGALIPKVGLAWTFRVLCLSSLVANGVSSILLRDRNKNVGAVLAAFDIALFKRIEFWGLLGFGIFSFFAYVMLVFSIPNYANEIGLSAHQASVVGALLHLGQGIGRPAMGYLSDKGGRINMAGLFTFLSGLFALVIWTNAKSYGVLIAYALLGGTVAGTYVTVFAPVTAEIVGLKELGSALSITLVVIGLPSIFTEAIGLQIVKDEGLYLGAQLYCGIMFILAALCLWFLKAWKIGQDELEKKSGQNELEKESGQTKFKQESGQVSPLLNRLFRWSKL